MEYDLRLLQCVDSAPAPIPSDVEPDPSGFNLCYPFPPMMDTGLMSLPDADLSLDTMGM